MIKQYDVGNRLSFVDDRSAIRYQVRCTVGGDFDAPVMTS